MQNNKLHILIIPPDEFQPENSHMKGIFAYHQTMILKREGNKVGALSLDVRHSFYVVFRTLAFRLIGIRLSNPVSDFSISSLFRMILFESIFYFKNILYDSVNDINVVRAKALYHPVYHHRINHKTWIRIGKKAFEAYVKAFGMPDIIHVHNVKYGGWIAAALKKKYQIPIVLTEHSSFIARGTEPPAVMTRIHSIYSKFDLLISVSPFLADCISRQIGKNDLLFHYVPNVIDPLIEKNELPVKKTDPIDSLKFLCVGSLLTVKGYDFLLKAFAQAFASTNKVELRIGGDGPEFLELRKLATSLNLSNKIKWLGNLDRDHVLTEMDDCDVFVSSSIFETFGVVIIEALSRGKPVVATNCGGPIYIIDANDGILCDAASVDSLAHALEKISSCLMSFNDQKIRSNAIKRFGSDAFYKRLNDLYKFVIDNSKKTNT